eukprot:Sro115_g056740.2  (589) ;mRNA; f:44859-46625
MNYQSGTLLNGEVSWSRHKVLDTNDYNDQVHLVQVTVAGKYFASGKLDVEFHASLSHSAASQSASIRDLEIVASGYWCKEDLPKLPSNNNKEMLAAPTFAPSAKPSLAGFQCTSSHLVVTEDFEAEDCEDLWHEGTVSYGSNFSHFLGRMGRGNEYIWREFEVPVADGDVTAENVTIEFALYQLDDWSEGTFSVIVGETEILLQGIASEPTEDFVSGLVDGIAWWRETFVQGFDLGFNTDADKKHLVELTVPGDKFSANGTLLLGFKADSDVSVSHHSAGVDNLNITANYDCNNDQRSLLAAAASTYDKKQDLVVAKETYESGQVIGWVNGLISQNDRRGHFLGRLGLENDFVSKTFRVPPTAESMSLEFDLYTLGNYPWRVKSDQFHVKIGITSVHVGSLRNLQDSGSVKSISWTRAVDPTDSNLHHVTMDIASLYFPSGELSVGFHIMTTDSIAKKSVGVDNLIITARAVHTTASDQERKKTNEQATTTTKKESTSYSHYQAPTTKQEPVKQRPVRNHGGVCYSEDFPCGGDKPGMVYICHYSIKKGYQTYCLNEEDTDIVRSYADDYCGPCVGGYGQQQGYSYRS